MQLDNQILTALIGAAVALLVAVLGAKINNGFLKFIVVLAAIGLFGFVGVVLVRPDAVCEFGFNLGDVCEQTGTETVLYDFVAKAKYAEWTNGSGKLPFNGLQNDSLGFVKLRENFRLEDGSQPSLVLQTHPQWVSEGEIVGEYALDAPLRKGDRFKAQVGFLEGAGGRVTFSVAVGRRKQSKIIGYVLDSAIDGELKRMEFRVPDDMVGQTAMLLIVTSDTEPSQDWAVWINARLYGRR